MLNQAMSAKKMNISHRPADGKKSSLGKMSQIESIPTERDKMNEPGLKKESINEFSYNNITLNSDWKASKSPKRFQTFHQKSSSKNQTHYKEKNGSEITLNKHMTGAKHHIIPHGNTLKIVLDSPVQDYNIKLKSQVLLPQVKHEPVHRSFNHSRMQVVTSKMSK